MSKKDNKNTPSLAPVEEDDLGQLRQILFGNLARSTEKKFQELETHLEDIYQELSRNLQQQVDSLANSAGSDLKTTRQEFAGQIQSVQDRLDDLSAETSQHIASVKDELSKQIEQLRQTLNDVQAESQQRDETLRARIQNLETSRVGLSQMFMEIGKQLQKDMQLSDKTKADSWSPGY